MKSQFSIYTDGGARGNPGPGAVGIVVMEKDKVIFAKGKFLGEKLTNNQAEYRAIIGGLEVARKMKVNEVKCFLDSELVVKQLKGSYEVKDQDLKILFAKVKSLEKDFSAIDYHHIRREKNKLADSLVNEALDNRKII